MNSDITKKYRFFSLSFREVNYVQVFGEYEYELLPADEGINSLIQEWGACSSTRAYAGHNADESDEADA